MSHCSDLFPTSSDVLWDHKFTPVRMMRIYFITINQSPKPNKYMGMNFYYQLALLTTYKVFSLSSTNLPGLDVQTEVRPDFSCVFSYLLGVQLLHQYILCPQVCMSQEDCAVSLEIIFKVIVKLNSILIWCKET